MTAKSPWTQVEAELAALDDGGNGAVILTHPSSEHTRLTLGRALRWALKGQTLSFNALVGWFGHSQGSAAADDPAAIILQEGREVCEHLSKQPPDSNWRGFRLLFGRANTNDARAALWAWYWLSRWSREQPLVAAQWREELLAAVGKRGFDAVATEWCAPEPQPTTPTAWRIDDVAQAETAFGLESSESRALWARWHQAPCSNAHFETVAHLLTYLVLMRADIRLGANHSQAQRWMADLFHPKLYVIERPEDSFVLLGSGNWSTPAFTRVERQDQWTSANVEVATMFRLASRAWAPNSDDLSTAARLAYTAFRLFDESRLFAVWEPSAPLPLPHEAFSLLFEMESVQAAAPAAPQRAMPSSRAPLAEALAGMIERVLGFEHTEVLARYDELFGALLFGGKRPERYQVDGALRLIHLLEHRLQGERRARGAFLTDEPGLGKTLVAQMVAVYAIADRLLERHRCGSVLPLRVTIVAPARLLGANATGDAHLSGWAAAWHELEAVLRSVLTAGSRAVSEQEANSLVGLVSVRVLSTQSFGRRLDDELGQPKAAVVADLLHVACSEVVLLDESHNFRNPESRSTRVLRFVLSLPVPREDWPIFLQSADKNSQPVELPAAPATGWRPFRSVLCISATPFNNRLVDFVTQVGHFARCQLWVLPKGESVEQMPLPGEDFSSLRQQLEQWAGGQCAVETAFLELLLRCRPHFEGQRALDPDDLRLEHVEQAGKTASASSTSDGGPLYRWAKRYEEGLAQDFNTVTECLQLVANDGEETPPEQAALARNRIDAVLARLVVQRSRGRVLRHLELEAQRKLFRTPEIPRHPLPLNRWGEAGSHAPVFEAGVLSDLYALLVPSSDDGEKLPPQPGATLTLLSYRLGVLRGRAASSTTGEAELAVRNLVGFQLAGLIKRLQSSPYAFLRTVLRGPLRRALFELALVERVANTVEAGTEAAASLEPALPLLSSIRTQLASRTEVGPALAELLGGSWA
ncbi:MAG: hypothetical protein RBU37_26395, partial [Myxococcota bacterium]|nr:hypothetical protein [Myxococcota bacterium]